MRHGALARILPLFCTAQFACSGCNDPGSPSSAVDASTPDAAVDDLNSGTVAGRVLTPTDRGLDVVPGAVVRVFGGPSTEADDEGRFSLSGVRAGVPVVLSVSGPRPDADQTAEVYSTFSATISVSAGEEVTITPHLMRGCLETLDSAAGGMIDLSQGCGYGGVARIEFPADALAHEDGQPFSGSATLEIAALAAGKAEQFAALPSVPTSSSGAPQIIGSIEVRIVDDANASKLDLASGKSVSVELPVPAGLLRANGARLGLYSRDEVRAEWVKEAVPVDVVPGADRVRFRATHFSSYIVVICCLPVQVVPVRFMVQPRVPCAQNSHCAAGTCSGGFCSSLACTRDSECQAAGLDECRDAGGMRQCIKRYGFTVDVYMSPLNGMYPPPGHVRFSSPNPDRCIYVSENSHVTMAVRYGPHLRPNPSIAANLLDPSVFEARMDFTTGAGSLPNLVQCSAAADRGVIPLHGLVQGCVKGQFRLPTAGGSRDMILRAEYGGELVRLVRLPASCNGEFCMRLPIGGSGAPDRDFELVEPSGYRLKFRPSGAGSGRMCRAQPVDKFYCSDPGTNMGCEDVTVGSTGTSCPRYTTCYSARFTAGPATDDANCHAPTRRIHLDASASAGGEPWAYRWHVLDAATGRRIIARNVTRNAQSYVCLDPGAYLVRLDLVDGRNLSYGQPGTQFITVESRTGTQDAGVSDSGASCSVPAPKCSDQSGGLVALTFSGLASIPAEMRRPPFSWMEGGAKVTVENQPGGSCGIYPADGALLSYGCIVRIDPRGLNCSVERAEVDGKGVVTLALLNGASVVGTDGFATDPYGSNMSTASARSSCGPATEIQMASEMGSFSVLRLY